MRIIAAAVVIGVVLLASPAPARADDTPAAPDTGYLGRGTDTTEIQSCSNDDAANPSRVLAAEHYGRGRNLYDRGDYEAAIEEFVAAYCHAPTAEAIFSIYQSFERLVNYEKAVAYLDRYILEIPDDYGGVPGAGVERRRWMSSRAEVLRNLPARVRVATIPRGATVTLTGTSGVRATGAADDEGPMLVRKGAYTMRVELAGYEPVEQNIDVQIGQPYGFFFKLEPKKGRLKVVADPPQAAIFLGEQRVGYGGYADTLPIGKYTITVEASGRVTQRKDVDVTEGDNPPLTIRLDKKPASGRTQLIIAAGVGGAAFGSSALAGIFDEESLLSSLGGVLGLGVSLGGAYFGVPDDIHVGTSSLIIGSSLIGAAEGFLVAAFISCDEIIQADGDIRPDDCSESGITGAALAAGVGGILGGALLGDALDISAGDAAIINSGALWGTIAGTLFFATFDQDARVDEALVFTGLNLGVITGIVLARRYDISRRHSALIDLSGLGGVIAGAALADVIDQDSAESTERQPHLALLGMTIGLITGAYLTRHMDEPKILTNIAPNVGATTDAAGETSMTFGFTGQF